MGLRSVVVLGAFILVPLSGCPGGADIEDADRFEVLQAGSGGTAGLAGAGGVAGTAGIAGGAGTAGAGGGITFVPPNCDYRSVLLNSCATLACHQTKTNDPPAAGLDLKEDGIEARVFAKPPTYTEISCPNPDGGALFVYCVPATCDRAAFLVAPGNPTASFLYKKLAGTHGDCGKTMPLPPGKLDAAGRACLEDWIEAVSNATVP